MRHFRAIRVGLAVLCGTMALLAGCKDITIPSEPLVASGQFDRIADTLQLTDSQRLAARDLYSGYKSEFEAAKAKLTAYFERADRVRENTGDGERTQKAKERAREKFDKYSDAIRAKLLEDLQAVVTPAQMARWPLVERRLRREELGEWGGLHGAAVDVAAVFESIEKPGDRSAAVGKILEQYEDAVDRPLLEGRRVKAAWEAKQQRAAARAKQDQGRDTENQAASAEREKIAAAEHIGRVLEITQEMQRLNLRTADEIADAMPKDRAAAFRGAFTQRAFGEFYAPTRLAEVFERVAELEDFTSAQRSRLAVVKGDYERAARDASARWASAVVAWERDRKVDMTREGEEPPPQSVETAKAAREAVDERFRKELAAILTPGQLEKFPGLAGNERLGEIEF